MSDIIKDTLKRKFGEPRKLTEQEITLNKAKTVSIYVGGRLDEVLKSLSSAQQYDETATGDLMMSLFKESFASWSKDELLYLCCLLHTSTMLQAANEQVQMGMYGAEKDKSI